MARHRRALRLVGLSVLILALALPAFAESRIEKNLALASGGKLVMDIEGGSISIVGSAQSGVHVVVSSTSDEMEKRYKFEFQEAPGEVRITSKKIESLSFFNRGIGVHFEIRAPKATSLAVHTSGGSIEASDLSGTADVSTSGGSIEVSRLAGNLKAKTSGGHIEISEIRGSATVETSGGSIEADSIDGPLEAHTSGGRIEIENVTGDAVLRTSGGSIEATNAGGRVIAKTSGGSIEVSFARGNSKGGNLETSGGSIGVTLDPSANLTVDASASSGKVSTDFPVQVTGTIGGSSLSGTIGKGGEGLRIHTSAGSIRIMAAK
jgi:hypothetical protein